MRRMANQTASREAAKDLICDLLAANGGSMPGTVRLNKAFYFAQLYYWSDGDGVLTDYPVVRLPNGPAIDDYATLLHELVEAETIAVSHRPVGPYRETVYRLVEDRPVADGVRGDAIRRAVELVSTRSAAELSELTHEFSRSWRETTNGSEMDIYGDLVADDELSAIRTQVADVRRRFETLDVPR